jgi:hypothetical protein
VIVHAVDELGYDNWEFHRFESCMASERRSASDHYREHGLSHGESYAACGQTDKNVIKASIRHQLLNLPWSQSRDAS